MQEDVRDGDDGRGTARYLRVAGLGVGLLTLGLLGAGCGGSTPGSGVAHLGTQTSTTSSSSAGPSRPGESSPGSQAVAYSACMRSHGVANFPDPQISHHGNEVSVKQAINPSIAGNPKFKPAQQACSKLLPAGGEPGNQPALTPAQQTQYLKAAACIRAHGVPNFPDPTFSGGGVHISQHVDLSSPTVKAAIRACESLIPGGVQGGSGTEHAEAQAGP